MRYSAFRAWQTGATGAGAAVAEALAVHGLAVPLAILGPHDADGIVQAIRRRFPSGHERQVANDG